MILINDIPSLGNPFTFELTVEDRIEKIELIGGNAVQDFGHVETGDVFSLECIFHRDNWTRIKTLWATRQLVTFTDVAGVVWQNLRIVIQRIKYVEYFPDHVRVTFQLWRI